MTEDIIDLNQLSINRLDHGKTILIAGTAIAALIFAMGFIDAIGGLDSARGVGRLPVLRPHGLVRPLWVL